MNTRYGVIDLTLGTGKYSYILQLDLRVYEHRSKIFCTHCSNDQIFSLVMNLFFCQPASLSTIINDLKYEAEFYGDACRQIAGSEIVSQRMD